MAKNIMTVTMEKITGMLSGMDDKLKSWGVEPYGIRKATEKEERERFENLTIGDLAEMIQKEGREATNKWLGKFMSKEEY